MKNKLLFSLIIALLGLVSSPMVFAQNDRIVSAAGDAYVISAKAGGVNQVEGKVSVSRQTGKSGYLTKNDELKIGDKVTTGADGKAEILLNPGSFVRLGGNTSFQFETTELDNLKLRLNSGSAILEVYADDEFKVLVSLPKSALELTRSGVYRIDVLADGSGKVSVWRGKVYVGAEKTDVKAGRAAVLNGEQTVVAKFDRDNKDELDVWSQLRAKEAAKINARLQRDALRNTLVNSFNRGAWDLYNSFGLWVFDTRTGRWCFLPFGSGWSSPYGHSYHLDLWYCRLPRYVYTQPPSSQPPVSGGGGQTPTSQNPSNEERRGRLMLPTFQRFENNQRGGEQGGGNQGDGGGIIDNRRTNFPTGDRKSDSPVVDTKPTYTPPPPPPVTTPIIVIPNNAKGKDN